MTGDPVVPWQPLEDYVVAMIDMPPATPKSKLRDGWIPEDIAVRLDTSAKAIHRNRRLGEISIWAADEYACHLGVNPTFIWGWEFLEVPDTCPNGHDRAEHVSRSRDGRRRCLECDRIKARRQFARKKERAAA